MLNLSFKVENGVLVGARQCPSPNFNARPLGTQISLLVVHNISLPPAQFSNGYIEQFFQNCLPTDADPYFAEIGHLTVSAHLLISREGEVVQFVNFNDRAWHAGVSCFAGRDNCNDFSIGIELEGTDDLAYTEIQYQTLAGVTRALQQHYPAIIKQNIVGHSDIAPGRKTDPGDVFEWSRYFELAGLSP